MRDFINGFTILIMIIFFTLAAIVGGTYFVFKYRQYWDPKFQSLERQIFEETQSYVHGANQELAKLYLEWKNASDEERAAIEEVIRMRFAQFPPDKVENPELRKWFEDIMLGER